MLSREQEVCSDISIQKSGDMAVMIVDGTDHGVSDSEFCLDAKDIAWVIARLSDIQLDILKDAELKAMKEEDN